MYHNGVKNVTMIASTNLDSNGWGHAVDYVANTNFKITGAAAGGGFGILQNSPKAGEHATVAIDGDVEVRVGVAVQAGMYAVSAASGFMINVASTTSHKVLGQYVTGAASGMIAVLRLNPFTGATA